MRINNDLTMTVKSTSDNKSKNVQKHRSEKDKSGQKKRKFDQKKSSFETLTPANKKRALKAERQSHRRHASTVRTAKEIWNELRVKSNAPDTNSKLCSELYGLLKGKMMEVALQHDASRMVQAVLQFGNLEERFETVQELCVIPGDKVKGDADKNGSQSGVNLAALCTSQYSHFVVLKMIKYCFRDKRCVDLIVRSLRKQMTKLAVHSVGSRVVELLIATFPLKSTASLKVELYGPQYSFFALAQHADRSNEPTYPTLPSFIEKNQDKRESTVLHLQNLIQKGLDKSLTGFAYFHSLLMDYVSVALPNNIRDFLAPALSEHCLHLISTRPGTAVVCECAAYGTVKDRKKILKCFKGYTRSSLLHRDAYLAILRIVDVMDDTVLVNKMLLAELHQNPDQKLTSEDNNAEEETPSSLLDLVLSETGSKLFMFLLVSKNEISSSEDGTSFNRWQKNFDPYEIKILHRNPCVIENGETVTTSKKEEDTRRQELLVYMKELLIDMCVRHAEQLMRSKAGSKVLIEVCVNFSPQDLFQAIVEVIANSLEKRSPEAENDSILPILEDPVGHLTLKNLFLREAKKQVYDDDDDDSIAVIFYSRLKLKLREIASSNRGAIILTALMKVPKVNEDVKKALTKSKKELSKLSKDGNKSAGFSLLLTALNNKI